MKKGQKICDTRDIFKSGECLAFPRINMDKQTIIDRCSVTLSIVSILRDLPPRYRPEYNDDLIKIRKNIKEVRENPERALERLGQEETRSNFKAYTKIHERGSGLEEDQLRDTVEFCLNTFRAGVERYKNTQRLGKTPMETILDERESGSEEENKQKNSTLQERLSSARSSSPSNEL